MRSLIFSGLICLTTLDISGQQPSPSPTPAAQTAVYIRPDKTERVNRYLKSMFGPTAIGLRVVRSGTATWSNSPPEWGGQWKGFGKRFASSTGTSVIGNTTAFALEEAFKLDSRYYRSTKKQVGAKIGNAVASPFIARNAQGKKVFGFPRIAGIYASNVISREVWYPARYSWKDGMRGGTMSLGTNVLFNLVKEFILR